MIDDLRNRFVYTSDKLVDSVRILSAPTGPLRGDCDDFAATALWLAEGQSMWNFWGALLSGRAAIWRTRTAEGANHAILWHRSYGWIENGRPRWRDAPAADLTLRYKRWPITVALKMLVGKIAGE